MNFEIFNLALMILVHVDLILAQIYNGLFLKRPLMKLKWYLLLLVSSLFAAPFVPFFTAVFFALILTQIHRYLRLPVLLSSNALKFFNYFYKFLLYLANLFLILVFGLAIIARFWGLDFYYALSTTAGIFTALYWLKYVSKNQNSSQMTQFQQKVPVLLALLLVVSTATSIGVSLFINKPVAIENGVKLHVMTYNILYITPEWDDRKAYVVDQIESVDPDILGTQEGHLPQLDYLNSSLSNRNYNWLGYSREDGNHTGEHNAIFYDQDKYHALENGTFWYAEDPTQPGHLLTEPILRICTWAKFEERSSGAIFYIYNTHFGFYPEFHIRASMWLNQHIASNTGEYPVIAMGDFNMPNFYPFYFFLEGWGTKPLREAYRLTHFLVSPFDGTTASGRMLDSGLSGHIDYLFVSEGIQVNTCTIIRGSYDGTRTPSDHFPVLMDCLIPRFNNN